MSMADRAAFPERSSPQPEESPYLGPAHIPPAESGGGAEHRDPGLKAGIALHLWVGGEPSPRSPHTKASLEHSQSRDG